MRQRIARQPLGDVLIVGRGPALVGTVGRQPRREAGQAAQAQQKLILALGSMGFTWQSLVKKCGEDDRTHEAHFIN